MARIFVEGWSPTYGTPFDAAELVPGEGSVDETVERVRWSPLPGVDDGVAAIAFVDGVRRIDARLTIDDALGPVPGLCGSLAVGAVRWDRAAARSVVSDERVERWAVLAGGRPEAFPPVDLRPTYETMPIADRDGDALVHALQSRMRAAEGELAVLLAGEGLFVIADGPLNELGPHRIVGLVKSHRVTYLSAEHTPVVAALGMGERTPLFAIKDFGRYSWYVRLGMVPDGHAWAGVVRCEASAHLPIAAVVTIADRTAAVLPGLASAPHIDPRAPQNLVPIGALERELRHRLGDPGLVYRALRAAVATPRAS